MIGRGLMGFIAIVAVTACESAGTHNDLPLQEGQRQWATTASPGGLTEVDGAYQVEDATTASVSATAGAGSGLDAVQGQAARDDLASPLPRTAPSPAATPRAPAMSAGVILAQAPAPQPVEKQTPTTEAEQPKTEAKEPASDSGTVDLATANQAFANPLAQATLMIAENDTVTLGGNLSHGDRTTNITVIEPLIPLPLGNSGWSLVNRPILPIAYGADVPVVGGGAGPTTAATPPGIEFNGKNGLGDFTFFSLLTPTKVASPFKWGVGPIFRFPTATQDELGSKKYSIGPAAVGLYSSKTFTIGALNQNLFSVAGDSDRSNVHESTLQYFVFYNFTPEWGIGTAPIVSVDWDNAGNGDGWSVPVGFGVTRTFKIGEIPTRVLVEGQRYVVRRNDYGPKWNIRFAFAMFFPLLF